MRILLVEDEVNLALALRRRLERDGHWVDMVHDGPTALNQASGQDYGAVLLDLMLPGGSGVDVCRELRQRAQWVPILVITARDGVRDRVRVLDAGADDYLIKPFAFAELQARLRAVLRRSPRERPTQLSVEDLVLDPATRLVTRGGRPIVLSTREYSLLEFLMHNRGTVVPRSLITRHVWGHDHSCGPGASNVADVYIGYLRRKLGGAEDKPIIQTVRGVGYQVG